MDTNEIIALGIVVIAVLLVIRYYRKSKGSCCGTDCLPKFWKKDKVVKPEDKK